MATIKRHAQAVWRGGGKDGKGVLATQSGALADMPYSANMRFGEDKGTNPEELIAAAHAGCFNMALAFMLSGEGHAPEELDTTAEVSIEKVDEGWRVRSVTLRLRGRVPGLSREQFLDFAEKAKNGCPVSNVLKADITLDADLA